MSSVFFNPLTASWQKARDLSPPAAIISALDTEYAERREGVMTWLEMSDMAKSRQRSGELLTLFFVDLRPDELGTEDPFRLEAFLLRPETS